MTSALWDTGAILCVASLIALFASIWLPHKPGYISPVQHHTRTAAQIVFIIGLLLALIAMILPKMGFQ